MSMSANVIVRLFPLLLPVWLERPPEETDVTPGPYPLLVTEEEWAFQSRAFPFAGRDQRCAAARQWGATGLGAAGPLLSAAAAEEGDPTVLAALLQQIVRLEHPCDDTQACRAWLAHPAPDLRYWAARAAAYAHGVPVDDLVELALEDSHQMVRVAAAGSAAARDDCPDDRLFRMVQNGGDIVRARALTALCRHPEATRHREAVAALRADDSVAVRSALAGGLYELPDPLVRTCAPDLATDAHATVRATAIAALGRRRDPTWLPAILAGADDPRPEVRRRSAVALRHLPCEASRQALLGRLADPRNLVRWDAERSLLVVHPDCPIEASLTSALSHDLPAARFHAYRLAGALSFDGYAGTIAAGLETETLAPNIGAAIDALGLLGHEGAAAAISRRANHESPVVRAAVGHALGLLGVPGTYETIRRLAFDVDETVRDAAILAMGRIADGTEFAGTLRRIFEVVNPDKMSAHNHAWAAWSAGRLRPVDPALIDRMVVQATTPVIPVVSSLVFEPDWVLASLAFGAVQCARADPAARPRAAAIVAFHRTPAPDPATIRPNQKNQVSPASPEVLEYGRQAHAYLEDIAIERMPRPRSTVNWLTRRLEPIPRDE